MKSNRDDRNSTSFYVTSSLCSTSSTILAGEGWHTSFSATHDQMFPVSSGSGDHQGQNKNRIHYVFVKVKNDMQCMVLHYLVGNWRLTGLGDRTQPLDRKVTPSLITRSPKLLDQQT
ncbi:hypothetical protein TNCV_1632051 [Trichonephila clavipes]|nr:hypothetical protein TNCV_1632051 [Trichonephila clavipes]